MASSVLTQQRIFATLAANRPEFIKLGVRKFGLFGSYARGEQREDSDVDLLVEFEAGRKTFENFIQLAFLLEDLLKRKVELVSSESLSPYLKPYIFREVQYVDLRA